MLKLLLLALMTACAWCTVAVIPEAPFRRIGEAQNPGPPLIADMHDGGLDDSQGRDGDDIPWSDYELYPDDEQTIEAAAVTDAPWCTEMELHVGYLPAAQTHVDADDPLPQLISCDDSGSDVGDGDDLSDSGSDDDLSPSVLLSWREAEKLVGLSNASRAGQPRPSNTPAFFVPAGAAFVPSKTFEGRVDGFVFTTRDSRTGYFREGIRPSPTPIALAAMIPPVLPDATWQSSRPPAKHAYRADGIRFRGRGRKARADHTPDDYDAIRTGATTLSDDRHRACGLWAVDTMNPNSWTSAEERLLCRVAADAILMQETKVCGDEGVLKLEKAARDNGWSAVASQAWRTASNFGSGGCAVLAARGMGIAPPPGLSVKGEFQHRIAVAWVAGFVKGGIHFISIYLKDGEGLSDGNMEILHEVASVIRQLKGPWVLAGDWNVDHTAILASRWPELVRGTVVAPRFPTCFASTYDFFVVSEGLAVAVAGIARIEDAGLHPHKPVRLFLHCNCRRFLTRQLTRPARVPGLLPHGPLPCPPNFDDLKPAGVDQASLDAAAHSWLRAAKDEWASLLGTPLDTAQPKFKWKPAAGPRAEQQASASAQSAFWRNAARRLDECAALAQRDHPHYAAIMRTHLEKIIAASRRAGFKDDELAPVDGWVQTAVAILYGADIVSTRKHAASAVRMAASIEGRNKARRLAEWKRSLVKPGPDGKVAQAPPSRAAYQWIRGTTGWTKSPVGAEDCNTGCLDAQEVEDDVPAHAIEPSGAPPRLWTGTGSEAPVPLSDQADIEREANAWGDLWHEGQSYTAHVDPHGTDLLEPLMPWALRASAMSFPISTGVGAENIAPRAVSRLSDAVMRGLCALLTAAELLGAWPTIAALVLIVLLPKPDGGRRPIGLFPAIIRIWARARRMAATRWEAEHARGNLYGGAGMGAQKAAWQSAFRAESAALTRTQYAQALLDLVKAFEKVPHDVLIRSAVKHGYNLWLLRLSLAGYRLPRSVGVDGTYSRLVVAVCGITAGSVFATTELRVIMLDAIDHTYRLWKSVVLSVYVDDCTLEHDGYGIAPSAVVAGATDTLITYLEDELLLEVSVVKSVTTGSSLALARRTARMTLTRKVMAVRSAKLLGTPAAGGRRRCVAPQRKRIKAVMLKAKKVRTLSKLRIKTKAMVRAAGTPALTYGWDVMGASDAVLKAARAVIASMVVSEAGGKNPDAILMVADSAGGTIDPAYDAHTIICKHWALAWWEGWQAPQLLEASFNSAASRLRGAVRTPWDVVTGPVTGLVASLWRLRWCILSPSLMRDDLGNLVDFRHDPPAAIVGIVKDSVRRWQFRKVAANVAGALPDTPDAPLAGRGNVRDSMLSPYAPPAHLGPAPLPQSIIGITAPLGKLLHGRKAHSRLVPGFEAAHRPWLRSAVVGGQWPQVRVAKLASEDIDLRCQLCFKSAGTLQHRFRCQAVVPQGGWPTAPANVDRFISKLSQPRRLALQNRGVLALQLSMPIPSDDGWLRWLMGSPDKLPHDARWYIDGSFIDGPSAYTGRTGFGAVAIGDANEILAMGYGVPPAWIKNAAGAEGWALHVVLRATVAPPTVTTDCLGLVEQLARGFADATSSRRPLARLWKLMAVSLDYHIPDDWPHGRLRWMPAHKTRAAIGTARRSDGQFVTYVDWRCNRLVDALAKTAAHQNRAPALLRTLLHDANQAVEYSAAVLGMATLGANHFVETTWRDDGTACSVVHRDAMPPAFNARGRGVRPGADSRRPTLAAPERGDTPSHPTAASSEAAALESANAARLEHHKAAKGRAKQLELQRALDAEARGHQAWLRDRAAAPAPAPPADRPSATERLEALRMRIAAKAEERL